MTLLTILRDGGVADIHDHRVAGHGNAPFHPAGVMVHHTASTGSALKVVTDGRADLHGPLCHLNIARDGRVNVVTEGLAWHAGSGSSVVLHRVCHDLAPVNDARNLHVADNTDGNPWFYGIEVDNTGVGEPYPDKQIAALVWACAALCQHHHWSAARVIHHREWTARKTDMSYRGPLRGLVRDRTGR